MNAEFQSVQCAHIVVKQVSRALFILQHRDSVRIQRGLPVFLSRGPGKRPSAFCLYDFGGVMQCWFFCVWLVAPRVISSRLIHVVACGRISFFFLRLDFFFLTTKCYSVCVDIFLLVFSFLFITDDIAMWFLLKIKRFPVRPHPWNFSLGVAPAQCPNPCQGFRWQTFPCSAFGVPSWGGSLRNTNQTYAYNSSP